MPIEPNGPAPYAPPSAFLGFLEAVRDKDLPTPYSADVVMRAGVTEALAARTLKTLKLFDLIDSENQPTDQLHDLAKAGGGDYKARLADVLRAAYADVFQYVDPSTEPLEKIQDQFRHYTPRGQRERMVTLFLGLCEFTGIAPTRERETKPRAVRKRVAKPAQAKAKTTKPPAAPKTESPPPRAEFTPSPPPSSGGNPFIDGLIGQLPEAGTEWSKAKRKAWTDAALAIFDLIYELPTEPAKGGEEP